MDTLNTIINRRPASVNNKTTSSQQISNTNGLPLSTITDQYGLIGLLQMIQQAEKNPDTSILLNYDLTTLGLSVYSFFFPQSQSS